MASRTTVTIPKQLESRRKNLARLTIVPTARESNKISSLRGLAYAMAAGLAVRLATMMFLYPDRLDPWRGHWRFAWEMGMVARSLATGKGFSSPFPPDTGATAWLGPVYPAVIAGAFKTFGLFTAASAIALLTLNSIFSVLTCIPIFLIARQTMGERQARWATWIWALFPYAIYISAGRIWENALTTFLLTVLVWYTLVLEKRATRLLWAGYGSLWALTALTNASTCALLPLLALWIAWRRYRRGERWLGGAAIGAILFFVLLAPWQIRNYNTFGHFIPLRNNFWMEVRVGNTGDITDVYQDSAHPARNDEELALYRQLGESAYMARTRKLATTFVRENPGEYAWLTVKRVVFTWTGFWSLNPVYMKNEPFQFPNTFFCTSVTLLALVGLRRLWRMRKEWVAPYVIALAFFPLVYYVTHPGMDYRHPIDPLIVILVAGGVVGFMQRRTRTKIH